jgi:glyoxylase-like metal-dependent hydrolase (beta-lactamase superfamily II)
MQIETIIVGQIDTNCYVVFDEESREAIIIDPGDEPDKIAAYIDTENLSPAHIIFTHAHYDHICAAKELKERYQAKIVMHKNEMQTYDNTKKLCMSWGYADDDFPPPDLLLTENDQVLVGKTCFRVIHTPGHTPGGICLHGGHLLFVGDTLFQGSVGRTDLPGGNMGQLLQSLKKLSSLDLSTRVLCGHEEETTIGDEMRSNPFMHAL